MDKSFSLTRQSNFESSSYRTITRGDTKISIWPKSQTILEREKKAIEMGQLRRKAFSQTVGINSSLNMGLIYVMWNVNRCILTLLGRKEINFWFKSLRMYCTFKHLFITGITSRDRIVVSTLRCGRRNLGSNPSHGRCPWFFFVLRGFKFTFS